MTENHSVGSYTEKERVSMLVDKRGAGAVVREQRWSRRVRELEKAREGSRSGGGK